MKAKELIEKYKNGQRDFRQVDLEGENLAWSTLSDADFRGANLQHVNFKGATLHRVKFNEGANLAFADLSSAELINTDLKGANLQGANLSETELNAIIDEHTQLPRGFQSRLYSGALDFSAYGEQIKKLKQENVQLQKKSENERDQTQIIITQLQKEIHDLKNKEQQKEDNQALELIVEKDNLQKQPFQNIEASITKATKVSLQTSVLHRLNKRSQREQVILDEAHSCLDLENLIKSLASKKWKEADKETNLIIVETTRRVFENRSKLNDKIYTVRLTAALQRIDQLWLCYSSGHFGFSIQASIWQSAGGDNTEKIKQTMEDYLGWNKDVGWCWYDKLNFTLDAPKGHLPARVYYDLQKGGVAFHSRWVSLLLKLLRFMAAY
jgi:hypothetical protein